MGNVIGAYLAEPTDAPGATTLTHAVAVSPPHRYRCQHASTDTTSDTEPEFFFVDTTRLQTLGALVQLATALMTLKTWCYLSSLRRVSVTLVTKPSGSLTVYLLALIASWLLLFGILLALWRRESWGGRRQSSDAASSRDGDGANGGFLCLCCSRGGAGWSQCIQRLCCYGSNDDQDDDDDNNPTEAGHSRGALRTASRMSFWLDHKTVPLLRLPIAKIIKAVQQEKKVNMAERVNSLARRLSVRLASGPSADPEADIDDHAFTPYRRATATIFVVAALAGWPMVVAMTVIEWIFYFSMGETSRDPALSNVFFWASFIGGTATSIALPWFYYQRFVGRILELRERNQGLSAWQYNQSSNAGD